MTIDTCPTCDAPTHASEGDDLGTCERCRRAALLGRALEVLRVHELAADLVEAIALELGLEPELPPRNIGREYLVRDLLAEVGVDVESNDSIEDSIAVAIADVRSLKKQFAQLQAYVRHPVGPRP